MMGFLLMEQKYYEEDRDGLFIRRQIQEEFMVRMCLCVKVEGMLCVY